MKLTFYGGVKEVTGANYLVESDEAKILIDCGLKQGSSISEEQNWESFPYNPREIDAVFITHSHIDHIGRLPKLYKDGFRGKVFSTPPCRDFSELLLYDSQHVMSLEAKRRNRPFLYEDQHIEGLMKLWEGVDYYQPVKVGDFELKFHNAGHILGSSFIELKNNKTVIVFSGDLGNSPAPLIGYKDELPDADYCLIESTYGDRIHEDVRQRQEIIEDLIEDVVKTNGTLMIPAFAMERTQQLLFEIGRLIAEGRVPEVPVFIDSPLAINLTNVYRRYRQHFAKEVIDNISPDTPLLYFPQAKKTLTTGESKLIVKKPPPKIIIAGSGMMHAGRILHHLKNYLPDPKSTLLIVGYQAEGSLGRRILDGAEEIKVMGTRVPVRAKVKAIGGYSAHADQSQLLAWLKPQRILLKRVFAVQGEADSSSALVQKINDDLAINAEIPLPGQPYNL